MFTDNSSSERPISLKNWLILEFNVNFSLNCGAMTIVGFVKKKSVACRYGSQHHVNDKK